MTMTEDFIHTRAILKWKRGLWQGTTAACILSLGKIWSACVGIDSFGAQSSKPGLNSKMAELRYFNDKMWFNLNGGLIDMMT